MPITVDKLTAAKAQLKTAIKLFFEDRDPISTHTLACAALAILHDHIPSDEAWKHDIILHYDSIYIKEEGRQIWAGKVRDSANFFKHADRDLKAGRTTIEFNPETTKFHIMEAIQCIRILEGDDGAKGLVFMTFVTWLLQNNPDLLKEEGKKHLPPGFYDSPSDKKAASEIIELLEKNGNF